MLIYICSVVGPSYFVVRFSIDDTISMIPRKNIIGTTTPSVDDCCEVKWSSGEVLMATVLAAGKCFFFICACTCTGAIHIIIQVISHQCG